MDTEPKKKLLCTLATAQCEKARVSLLVSKTASVREVVLYDQTQSLFTTVHVAVTRDIARARPRANTCLHLDGQVIFNVIECAVDVWDCGAMTARKMIRVQVYRLSVDIA